MTDEARTDETVEDEERIDGVQACEQCDGSGTDGAENCSACDGSGSVDTGSGETFDGTEESAAPTEEAETRAAVEDEDDSIEDPDLDDDIAVSSTSDNVPPEDPAENAWETCPQCNGVGNVEQGSADGDSEPGDGDHDEAVCPTCNGSGQVHAVAELDGGGKSEVADRPPHDNEADNYNDNEDAAASENEGADENRDAEPEAEARIKVLDSEEQRAIRNFESRYGRLGEKEIRHFTVGAPELRDSGAGPDYFTVRGHAAVFNKESLDLGWFTEYIEPGAFDRVLGEAPDVRFDWDHDTRWMLARTRAGNLDLGLDPIGLTYWARVNGGLSYAQDLKICLEEGLIDQASFMFTVARDRWEFEYDEDGYEVGAKRYIIEVGELYDVTVCAMGAYPQTDSGLARTYFFENARHIAARSDLARRKLEELKAKADEKREATAEPNPSVARAKLKAKAARVRSGVR